MKERLKGIVLQHHAYSDTSLIVKVFTESLGLQSYLIKGAYNPKGKLRAAFFQPMTMIEFVAEMKPGRDLHYMSEIGVGAVYHSIPFDMEKNAVSLFISELLAKTILGQETQPALYDFIYQSMLWLDLSRSAIANFPLYFCFEYSRYLGFYPGLERANNEEIFDLMEGSYRNARPAHGYYVDGPLSLKIRDTALTKLEELHNLNLTNNERRELLKEILIYYRLHLPGFNGLKSHEVLREVLG